MKASTIILATAMYYEHTVGELMSRDRHHPLAEHRQVAMYLCRELAGLSSLSVGVVFDRDHTTVLYAQKRIGRAAKGRLAQDIRRITDLLERGVAA